MFCSILESAAVRSETEVVTRCENDAQVDDMVDVVFIAFHCWRHAVVTIVSRFTVGYEFIPLIQIVRP